jgi:hypothetical protein
MKLLESVDPQGKTFLCYTQTSSICASSFHTVLTSSLSSFHNRLVTMAYPPYKIVFVNAAFDALTGTASNDTLGRDLSDLVVQGAPGSVSLEACAASSSAGEDTKVYTFCQQQLRSSIKTSMKVTPIALRTAGEISNVTHFALDLVDVNDIPEHKISERRQRTEGLSAPIQVFA